MADVACFAVNPFSMNACIVYDDSKEAILIDPGCLTPHDEEKLVSFIDKKGLKPVRLINTHGHLDHVFGNHFFSEKYNLPLEMHEEAVEDMNMLPMICRNYGVPEKPVIQPGKFLTPDEEIKFGNTELDILFTPGHARGHLSFYSKEDNFVIAGDTIFYGSIGRTDLPGGNMELLLHSIVTQLFTLPDGTIVYNGHGPSTTIGREKQFNPFLKHLTQGK